MQARSTVRCRPKIRTLTELCKAPFHRAISKTSTARRSNKRLRRFCKSVPFVARSAISLQLFHCRIRDGHQSHWKVLTLIYSNDSAFEINVFISHRQYFADSHSRACESTDHCCIPLTRAWIATQRWLVCQADLNERRYLSWSVDVWRHSFKTSAQESRHRDLSSCVKDRQVSRERSYCIKPFGVVDPLAVIRQGRPLKRQLGCEWLTRCDLISVLAERTQQVRISLNVVTKRPSIFNILIDRRCHSAGSNFHTFTSGHSAATVRNAGKSTCAYNVVVCSELCPSTSAIDLRPMPSCFIRVATVCRSMCVPDLESFIPERRQATLTILFNAGAVVGSSRGIA